MFEKIINTIESTEMSVIDWLLGFAGIMFVRFLLEAISSPTSSGVIASDAATLVQYALFYITAICGSLYIVDCFAHTGMRTAKYMLFFFTLAWLAPLLDSIISKGGGFYQSYIFDTGYQFVRDFLTFGGPNLTHGATIGIRVELLLVFFGVAYLVWFKTRNIWKSIGAFVCMYTFAFLISALPAVVYMFSTIFVPTSHFQSSAMTYIVSVISTSNLLHNSIHATMVPVSAMRFVEIGFDKFMSQILFLISSTFLFVWFRNSKKAKLYAILKNSRPERIIQYIVLLGLGMWCAYVGGFGHLSSWFDMVSILCLIIAWYNAWVFAININDCEDISIDIISNTDRPLVQQTVSEKEMRQSGLIFLCVALLGSWSVGYYPFYMMLVYIASSYIYSARPLRLKMFPIVSTFLMGVACLASVLAGFFFVSINKNFYSFSPLAMLGVLVFYTLLFNVKDLKDIDGDRASGIMTIPVLCGQKWAYRVCGMLFSISFLLAPIFFSIPLLYITAIPSAFAGYYVATRKPYKEKYLFIVYIIFIVVSVFLFSPIYH